MRTVILFLLLVTVTCRGEESPMQATKMTTHAAIVWGKPVGGLRLGVGSDGVRVVLALENVGITPLEVLSHVQTHELQFDWYTITLRGQDGRTRKLALVDERRRSWFVRATLAPAGKLEHRIDVSDWAGRLVNDSQPLGPGTYEVSASYEVSEPGGTSWSGRLEAGPATLTVPK